MLRRQRNNIARLPAEVRRRICDLLYNANIYDNIRNDSVVVEACKLRKIKKIHSSSFGAFKKGAEYFEYCERIKNSDFPLSMDERLLIEAYREFSRTEKESYVKDFIVKSEIKKAKKAG